MAVVILKSPFPLFVMTAVVRELKLTLLLRSADTLLRLSQDNAMAVNMTWMLSNDSKSCPKTLQAIPLTWIAATFYGGVCGLIATLTNRHAMATQVLVCWLIIVVFHAWYLVDGRHRLLHLPQPSCRMLIAKIAANLLSVLFLAGVTLAMRSNPLLLGSGGILQHSAAPIVIVV